MVLWTNSVKPFHCWCGAWQTTLTVPAKARLAFVGWKQQHKTVEDWQVNNLSWATKRTASCRLNFHLRQNKKKNTVAHNTIITVLGKLLQKMGSELSNGLCKTVTYSRRGDNQTRKKQKENLPLRPQRITQTPHPNHSTTMKQLISLLTTNRKQH